MSLRIQKKTKAVKKSKGRDKQRLLRIEKNKILVALIRKEKNIPLSLLKQHINILHIRELEELSPYHSTSSHA